MIRDTFETFFEPISLVFKLSTAPKGMVVNTDAQSIGHRMMDSEVEISKSKNQIFENFLPTPKML